MSTGGRKEELAPRFPLPQAQWAIETPAYCEWNLSRAKHLELLGEVSVATSFVHGFIMNFQKVTPHIGAGWMQTTMQDRRTALQVAASDVQWFSRAQGLLVQSTEIALVLGALTWGAYSEISCQFCSGLVSGAIAGVAVAAVLAPHTHYRAVLDANPQLSRSQLISKFCQTFRPGPKYLAFFTMSHVLHYAALCGLYRTFKYDLDFFQRTDCFFAGVWFFELVANYLQYYTMQLYWQTFAVNERLLKNKLKPVNEWIVFYERFYKKGRMTAIGTGFFGTRPGLRSCALGIAVTAYDRLCCARTLEGRDTPLPHADRALTHFWRDQRFYPLLSTRVGIRSGSQ
jgi:hypothetical protein